MFDKSFLQRLGHVALHVANPSFEENLPVLSEITILTRAGAQKGALDNG
jgi:hypothetical protein